MSKNVKTTNPIKVITVPNTHWNYTNVLKPKSINGVTLKYSVSLIILKSNIMTVAKIEVGIVDVDRNPISTRSEIYSGVYSRASISFYILNSSDNKDIHCGLNNLQKVRDDDPLGCKASAESDFATADNDLLN